MVSNSGQIAMMATGGCGGLLLLALGIVKIMFHCCSATNPSDVLSLAQKREIGHLEGREVTQGHKPLYIVLISLGLVTTGVTVAAIGAHIGWWPESISRLGQISMMAAGGGSGFILLSIGIIGLITAKQARPLLEKNGTWTYIKKENGSYDLIMRKHQCCGAGKIVVMQSNIDSEQLHPDLCINGYEFVSTEL